MNTRTLKISLHLALMPVSAELPLLTEVARSANDSYLQLFLIADLEESYTCAADICLFATTQDLNVDFWANGSGWLQWLNAKSTSTTIAPSCNVLPPITSPVSHCQIRFARGIEPVLISIEAMMCFEEPFCSTFELPQIIPALSRHEYTDWASPIILLDWSCH
jgi:hypothetical protein